MSDNTVPGAYINLRIELVKESRSNPRTAYDKTALRELAESIKAQGILEPLVVRPIVNDGRPPTDPVGWELVAGSRRLRAAKLAGLTVVPAIVRDLTDAEVLQVQIIENLQREGISALDEARGYAELITQLRSGGESAGDSIGKVAGMTGKSKSYVYQRIKLLDAIKPVQKLLDDGEISAQHGIRLARLPKEIQQKIVKEGLDDVSVRALEDTIDEVAYQPLAGAPWSKADARLVPDAGACTVCPKNTSATDTDGMRFFPDVKENLCTDPTCFAVKLRVHLAAKIKDLRERGVKFTRVSTDYYPPKGSALLGHSSYREVTKKTPNAQLALVVDGDRVGQTMYILPNNVTREAQARRSAKITPARRRELREIKISTLALQEIRRKKVQPFGPADYRAIAGALAPPYSSRWKQVRGQKLLEFIRTQVLDELESDVQFGKYARVQVGELAREYKVNLKQLELELDKKKAAAKK
jgi:ParB/RepB/Spo0J family partition protein